MSIDLISTILVILLIFVVPIGLFIYYEYHRYGSIKEAIKSFLSDVIVLILFEIIKYWFETNYGLHISGSSFLVFYFMINILFNLINKYISFNP